MMVFFMDKMLFHKQRLNYADEAFIGCSFTYNGAIFVVVVKCVGGGCFSLRSAYCCVCAVFVLCLCCVCAVFVFVLCLCCVCAVFVFVLCLCCVCVCAVFVLCLCCVCAVFPAGVMERMMSIM